MLCFHNHGRKGKPLWHRFLFSSLFPAFVGNLWEREGRPISPCRTTWGCSIDHRKHQTKRIRLCNWLMLGAIIKRTVDGSEIPNNHLKCVNLVNNGINYLSLNWCSPDFWTINSIVKSILSNILSGILATVTCEFFSPSFYVAAFPALSDQNSEWKSRVIFFSVLRFFTFKTLQLFLLESIWVFPKVGKHPKMDGL